MTAADKEDPFVTSVEHRSARVRQGSLFVAIKGERADGHTFVEDAVGRGAAAVVAERPVPVPDGVALLLVDDSRKALGNLAAFANGEPSERLVMIGITGTNGKTTIAWLVEQVLSAAGESPGVIGTINYRYDGKAFDNPLTTPEASELQRILKEMADSGTSHVVMEVSSHGLALERVRGCRFDVAVFSNLSQDHLDFHKDMGDYAEVKKRLFSTYLGGKKGSKPCAAVINISDSAGSRMLGAVHGCRLFKVGRKEDGAEIYPVEKSFDLSGIRAVIETPAGRLRIRSPLAGAFNLENILCAAALGVCLGVPVPVIEKGIGAVENVPGRLERISDEAGRHVFVDYAHTPDALENVLNTLREITSGRLVCVFGCGGDRDKDKRPKMGDIAGRLSDIAVITSDNPRSESPMTIIEAIRQGTSRVMPRCNSLEGGASAARETSGYIVEPDRKKAILLAIEAARAGDAVLIAGKGHETYQIIKEEILPFDDRQMAIEGLSRY
jgi:UDP-N-acetylmuramyl-tripeptide synthetase